MANHTNVDCDKAVNTQRKINLNNSGILSGLKSSQKQRQVKHSKMDKKRLRAKHSGHNNMRERKTIESGADMANL